jgi:hypothetical protein
MKKNLLLLLSLMTLTASAQKDELPDGVLAIELQANPFSNDFNTFKMTELKARLWLNNKHVVRFAVGLGMDTTKDDTDWSFDSRKVGEGSDVIQQNRTDKTDAKELRLTLGYEYHLAQAGRLDFYVGASAGYEGKYYSGSSESTESWTRYGQGSYVPYPNTGTSSGPSSSSMGSWYHTPDYGRDKNQVTITNTSNKTDYKKMSPNGTNNEHTIFANVFTGVDCYIYKGLYIGTELGISFKHGKSENGTYTRTSTKTVTDNGTITVNTLEEFDSATGITDTRNILDFTKNEKSFTPAVNKSSSSNHLKIYVEPAIRIGWIF